MKQTIYILFWVVWENEKKNQFENVHLFPSAFKST